MLPDPFVSYELAKAHQEELRYDAQLVRWAKAVSASRPQRTERLLSLVFSRLSEMVFCRKTRGKTIPDLGGHSKHSAAHLTTSGCCQWSAANMLNHPSLPSIDASQPNGAMPTAHGVSRPHGSHGHAG